MARRCGAEGAGLGVQEVRPDAAYRGLEGERQRYARLVWGGCWDVGARGLLRPPTLRRGEHRALAGPSRGP